jgi:hypothetical protein
MVALRLPVADGVKVALIVQLAPAASVLGLSGHWLVGVKSPGLVPVMVTLVMVSGAVPLLVTVTDCDALVVLIVCVPKLRAVVLRVTAGAIPVPLRATVCGLPLALSAIDKVALRFPDALGVKVALIVQLALAASVLGLSGHWLAGVKSPGLVPVRETLVMVRSAVPLLVSVTDCDALVVLIS